MNDKNLDKWCVQVKQSQGKKEERLKTKKGKQRRKDVGKGSKKTAVKCTEMGLKGWTDGMDEKMQERFGGVQIEWRSLSVYGGLKPHVSAWGEDTTILHTHARKECRHLHPPGALVSRMCFSCQLCWQKPLTCHLHCIFRLLHKIINKYTPLFHGHLPLYSAS